MKKMLAVMMFLAMLCGAIQMGSGASHFGIGASAVYAGGSPMDDEVKKP